MPKKVIKNGAQIHYKDRGAGEGIDFSHGAPLSADAWDAQMPLFGQRGSRVIAHDRRGHRRSSPIWDGNEMDAHSDNLAVLLGALDSNKVTTVGHSMGGGEITSHVGGYCNERVAKAVLMSAVPPLMLKTERNPGGFPHGMAATNLGEINADLLAFFQRAQRTAKKSKGEGA